MAPPATVNRRQFLKDTAAYRDFPERRRESKNSDGYIFAVCFRRSNVTYVIDPSDSKLSERLDEGIKVVISSF